MGDFVLKPNQGSLFKNKKKETDKHPDYTGTVNVGGKLMRLSAWLKDGAKGKWMSLSLSEPREADRGSQKRPARGFRRRQAFLIPQGANR